MLRSNVRVQYFSTFSVKQAFGVNQPGDDDVHGWLVKQSYRNL